MAKNRELSSIEHGLAEAIKNLKTEIIEASTPARTQKCSAASPSSSAAA